jgi:hypothetical protein
MGGCIVFLPRFYLQEADAGNASLHRLLLQPSGPKRVSEIENGDILIKTGGVPI